MIDLPDEHEPLRTLIEEVRAAAVFGRSDGLRRLFDYLAEQTLAGKAPKEVEIAIEVFGRNADSLGLQDATVRVHVHKLRRKLGDYFATAGHANGRCLIIPKGEYRLMVSEQHAAATSAVATSGSDEAMPAEMAASDPPLMVAAQTGRGSARRFWIAAVVLLCGNALAWAMVSLATSPAMREANEVSANPLWRSVLDDELPIFVVVGDYYIFGEVSDSSMDPLRLVREFDINSRNDLEKHLKSHPTLAERYADVSLQYLPVSTAYALQNIIPLLQPAASASKKVQVILASDLTPAIIKSSHIIYLGLLSGLGILRELAFSGSMFSIGDSYDELVARESRERFVSQASGAVDSRSQYRDYAYFATVAGPSGNRILIVAGTRDVAATHVAEAITHRAPLAELSTKVGGARDFEALYSVEAIERTNLAARLLLAKPRPALLSIQ